MYIITSVICSLNAKGINVNENALNDVESVIRMIFTPINSLIVLSLLGNTFGKVKDNVISTEKAGKRLIIIAVAFIVILIFESSYMGGFIRGLLG